MPPSHIAVIGGGLAGLSSAFHLSRRYPAALVTLLEKETRLGGWVRSDRIEVRDEHGRNASILLEAGPRTLRPNSKAVLELINLLGLQKSIITTPRTAPAARNRFLYIPPSPGSPDEPPTPTGLIQIPISFTSLFTSPLARAVLLPAILREPFTAPNRPGRGTAPPDAETAPPGADAADESFDAFCARRFGPAFARTFASALVHGVYAADARTLSVRAAFPTLWDAEQLGRGSVVRGLARRALGLGGTGAVGGGADAYELGDVPERMVGASVFSFREGIAQLTDGMVGALRKRGNVRLVGGVEVRSVAFDGQAREFQLGFASPDAPALPPALPPISHVVSSLPLPRLAALLPRSARLPHLNANPTSSVTLVNLVFPPTARPLHPAGFGYLIPRPAGGYDAAQPGVLGAVFDSCALAAQDTDDVSSSPGGAGFTKLTVMLGGPHPITPAHTALPAVLAQLSRHLGTALPEPVYARTLDHKQCIPTPAPGHLGRMDELRAALGRGVEDGGFDGRMEVVGAGVGGVSVGDCVEQGRKAGKAWA